VQPLVDEIAGLIEQDRRDPGLKWYMDGSVQVLIGQVVPNNAFKQTVQGRRRRFRTMLREQLLSREWIQATGRAPSTFVKAP
jgi:hypothetical protein